MSTRLNDGAMLSRKTFLRAGAGAAAASLAGRALGADAADAILVAAIPSDISGQAYYALEAGMFKRHGLDAKMLPFTNGASISAAIAGGSAEVGYSNVVSLATAHQRGLPFTILAPANLHVHGSPTAGILAVKKTSPVQNAKDLTGKIVAVIGLNNIAHLATRYWIDKNGGDSTTVHFVELPFSEMSPAVISGRVDAAALDAVGDPTAGKSDDPLRRLGSTFDAVSPHFAPSVWFSTTEWVAKHPATAKAFVAAMHDTVAWAHEHHAESAQILEKYGHATAASLQSVTRATYGDKLTVDLIQPSIDVAARYHVIASGFPAKDLISAAAAM